MKRLSRLAAAAAMTRRRTAGALAASTVAASASATFASCSAQGDYAVCDASGTATNPIAIIGSTLCLDDPAYSAKNGTQLIVYTCKNSANQHWSHR
jgi:hypothetical protein